MIGSVRGFDLRIELARGGLDLRVALSGHHATPVAVIGPNGSGKTTLLRALAGAITPDAGHIHVGEAVLYDSERGIDVPPETRRLGYVPQGFGLFPHLTALGNVAFGLSVGAHRLPASERKRRARAMLRALDCEALAPRFSRGLSGGEQQRVALARALVVDPAMLLLDEPLSALDVGNRRRIRELLAIHLRDFGRPTLVTTHDVRDVAAIGAEVCVLEDGQVLQRGSLDELRRAPASDFVAEFLGG